MTLKRIEGVFIVTGEDGKKWFLETIDEAFDWVNYLWIKSQS